MAQRIALGLDYTWRNTLSQLRRQIVQAQKERDALIKEMQEKNFGSKAASR